MMLKAKKDVRCRIGFPSKGGKKRKKKKKNFKSFLLELSIARKDESRRVSRAVQIPMHDSSDLPNTAGIFTLIILIIGLQHSVFLDS